MSVYQKAGALLGKCLAIPSINGKQAIALWLYCIDLWYKSLKTVAERRK
ncbi:MAG: hypothetical protein JXB29_02650 [Sedimentisphaerales bacterium]|nr:hypothetical protein [Sedimentisphaerales bacterium]